MIRRQHGNLAGLLVILALMTTACSSDGPRTEAEPGAEQPAPEAPVGSASASALVGQWEDTHTMPIEFRADGEVHHALYGPGTYRMESDGRLRMDFGAQSVFATFTVDGSDTITMKDQFMGETYVLYRRDTGAREAALKAQSDAAQAAEGATATAEAVVPPDLIGRWESIEAYTKPLDDVTIDIRADNTFGLELPAMYIGRQDMRDGSYQIDNSDTKYGNHDGSMTLRFSGGRKSTVGYRIDRENYPDYGDVLILFLEEMGLETTFLRRAE